MNDFESKLKTLLNEQVDAQVGRRRTPPPFEAPSAAERANRRWFGADRAPWMLPLLAAACVAAVVGATLGAGSLLAADKQVPAGTSLPTPSLIPSLTSTPVPTTASTTAPPDMTVSTALRTGESAAPNRPPDYHLVPLGGASIALPAGWHAESDGAASSLGESWCLFPKHPTATQKDSGCPIHLWDLSLLAPPTPKYAPGVDVDAESFDTGDPPQFCSPDHPTIVEQTGDRAFGNRYSDWRLFDRTCPDGRTFESEQYLVATNPAYGMFAWLSDPQTHAAMTVVAEYSTLPAQTDPLRLADRGVITSVVRGASAVTVTIDRVVQTVNGERYVYINRNPTTYTYSVPTALFDEARVGVGQRIFLQSDGRTVTRFYRDH